MPRDRQPRPAPDPAQDLQALKVAAQQLRDTINRVDDPFDRAGLTTTLIEWLLQERAAVQRLRIEAVTELRPEYSYGKIAERIGRSKSLAAALAREAKGQDPRYRKRRRAAE